MSGVSSERVSVLAGQVVLLRRALHEVRGGEAARRAEGPARPGGQPSLRQSAGAASGRGAANAPPARCSATASAAVCTCTATTAGCSIATITGFDAYPFLKKGPPSVGGCFFSRLSLSLSALTSAVPISVVPISTAHPRMPFPCRLFLGARQFFPCRLRS